MKAGNSQAMRDALLSIRGIVNSYNYKFIKTHVPRLCDAALSSPPGNCEAVASSLYRISAWIRGLTGTSAARERGIACDEVRGIAIRLEVLADELKKEV